jgi:hypothetical protein
MRGASPSPEIEPEGAERRPSIQDCLDMETKMILSPPGEYVGYP